MTIRKNSIVVLKGDDGEWSETNFRVEDVDGRKVTMRSLGNYTTTKADVDDLALHYQVDTFETGDIVRVRREYAHRYGEVDGGNELTVVYQKWNNPPTTVVENICGDEFSILNERVYLVKPAKSFKEGDRVVVDLDLAKKYDHEDATKYWEDAGVLVLTEDSGSRSVKYTSHVRYEDKEGHRTNNVPTRWLKLYEEPAKRAVGDTIKVADIKVGDKVKASYTFAGCQFELTGPVSGTYDLGAGYTVSLGNDVFLSESKETVFILLEEAPEPVDKNLQRLLDAEIGDIAHGTYAGDYYWKKVGDDEWTMVDDSVIYAAEQVFEEMFKIKYGELHLYRKVEDVN